MRKFKVSEEYMTTETDIFQSAEYKRSRIAYRWECTFEYFVALLVGDAFLASLLSSIGISDAITGIISSFISLAFLFQIFSIFVVRKISNIKRFVAVFHSVSQLLFMSLYLVPFLPFAFEYKQAAVIVCILAAYFGNYLVTSIIYKWGNSYVDPHKRGTYSAGKEMLSLFAGMIVTVIVGQVMDYFEMMNNLEGGFIFTAISIFIFAVCDFTCLMLIKNQIISKEKTKKSVPLKQVLKNTLGNRSFVNLVILTCIWDIGRYTTIGFLGTYRIKELFFTVGTVQIINIVANLGRFAVSKPFGIYSDKRSYTKGAELGLIIVASAFAVNIFAAPGTRLLMIVYTVLFNVGIAGINQNFFNMTYSYVDSEYFVEASAIKSSIGGLCGFGASVLASRLLDYVQANGNTLFGITVYGQQLLSLISFVLIVIAILFNHFVISKQKIMIQ